MLMLRVSPPIVCGCQVWGTEEEANFFLANIVEARYLPNHPGWARCVFKGREGPTFEHFCEKVAYSAILPKDWDRPSQ